MDELKQRSIEIILQNQSASGAYIASPNFPNYRYCWFRDSAFTAYAMDLVGEHASAARFHAWAANVVNERRALVENAVYKARQGKPLDGEEVLNTRYTLDGKAAEEAWPNFQLDGLGTWLWALAEHKRLAKDKFPDAWLGAARLVAEYLANLWSLPCYDCWEEFPDKVHTYTLATIHTGLRAYATLSGANYDRALTQILNRIVTEGVKNGHFVKFLGSASVDASLIGLAVPYRVVDPHDRVMQATVAEIESTIRSGVGLRRYSSDTYYGGGEWVLLTAWLGWYYAEIGEAEKATKALEWLEAHAEDDGSLPEQVPGAQSDPEYLQEWRQRWGEIANPLLWSHAMHIILTDALAIVPL